MSATPTDSTNPPDSSSVHSNRNSDKLGADKIIDVYKFYEESAARTKGHAWSQTTWILALNAGLLAFSAKLYSERREAAKLPLEGFLIVEWALALGGVCLCAVLFYVLGELGIHIRNYWEGANKVRAEYPVLDRLLFIPPDDGSSRWRRILKPLDFDNTPLPGFCLRLRFFAVLFIFADLAWALIVTVLVLRHPG